MYCFVFVCGKRGIGIAFLKRWHWNTDSSPLSERAALEYLFVTLSERATLKYIFITLSEKAALEYVFVTFVRKGAIGIRIHHFIRKGGIGIHSHHLCQKGRHWNTDPSPLSEREPLECYY